MQNEGRPDDELDRSAVRCVLSGDVNAFEGLYARNLGAIRAIGYRFFRAGASVRGFIDIDDFVQDVFTKAFTALGSYNGSGRFRSWLQRIAFTTAMNHHRHTAAEDATDPAIMEVSLPGHRRTEPDAQCMIQEAIRTVGEALATLPRSYSHVVELFYVFRLKYREISEITEIPIGTLKAQVHRARKALTRIMDPAVLAAFP